MSETKHASSHTVCHMTVYDCPVLPIFFQTLLSHWKTLSCLSPLWEPLWWGPESWHIDFRFFFFLSSLSSSGCMAVETVWYRSSYHSYWKAVFHSTAHCNSLPWQPSTHRTTVYWSNRNTEHRHNNYNHGPHTALEEHSNSYLFEEMEIFYGFHLKHN